MKSGGIGRITAGKLLMPGERLLVPLDQNLFGWFVLGGEAGMLNAAAIEIAVPFPPVHSVEPGSGPEGFENGLVTAHLGGQVDGVVPPRPGPWADAGAAHTLETHFGKNDRFTSFLME